jgi:hypothetical protein
MWECCYYVARNERGARTIEEKNYTLLMTVTFGTFMTKMTTGLSPASAASYVQEKQYILYCLYILDDVLLTLVL